MPAQQMEFPSLAFPADRSVLYVYEVAAKLRCTEQHVTDLIEEGKMKAINIAGLNESNRRFYRIPIEAYERYVKEQTL